MSILPAFPLLFLGHVPDIIVDLSGLLFCVILDPAHFTFCGKLPSVVVWVAGLTDNDDILQSWAFVFMFIAFECETVGAASVYEGGTSFGAFIAVFIGVYFFSLASTTDSPPLIIGILKLT